MAAPVTVAITLGDPCGIGPEIVAAALARPSLRRALRPVVFGDDAVFARAARAMGVPDRLVRLAPGEAVPAGGGLVCVSSLAAADRRPGRAGRAAGEAQGRYLEAAIACVREGGAEALCTAPVSKAALHAAGWDFPGHTELLAARFGAERVAMMLAGPSLRVVLQTIHVALAEVPARLSAQEISATLQLAARELRERFGVRRPRIAVCALNPHAGEGGAFGDEEARVIVPGLAAARAAGVHAEGPFAADGLFARLRTQRWDAVLAMYHDQGLIPLKLLDFEHAVNVTLGLPAIRTSPDHGVAYDLAGRGKADPSSMIAALTLAVELAQRWRRRRPAAPSRRRARR